MRLRLEELQIADKQAKKMRVEKQGRQDWEGIDGVLHHWKLFYVPEIIQTKLISCHQKNLLADNFGIKKTWELVAQKYYGETLCHDVKDNVKRCNVCLALKTI